jgi:hypothetical protein
VTFLAAANNVKSGGLGARAAAPCFIACVFTCLAMGAVAGLISPAPAFAGEDRPAIVEIDLKIDHGYLTADITTRGLFPERITGTIESGLPAVVDFIYHLVEPGGNPVEGGVRSYSLNYDVWEDVYSVSGPDSTVTLLPSLEAMRSIIEHMKGMSLVPVDKMVPERTYFIQMSVAVSPLQGTEREEMEGWVMRTVEGGGTSWHEQVLNINELIETFFSGNDSRMRSKWYRSEDFRPRALAQAREEDR